MAASAQGRAWQPTRPGAKKYYQSAQIVSPPQQKDPCGPHGGTSREYSLSDKRGVCSWGYIGRLLQKDTSPRSGNITNLPDKEKYKWKLRQNEATEEHVPDKGTR